MNYDEMTREDLIRELKTLKSEYFKMEKRVQNDIAIQNNIQLELLIREQFLNSVFKSVPVGIGVVIDRVIKFANDRLCTITGYLSEEMLERNARFLYIDDNDYEYVGKEKYEQISKLGTGSVFTKWKRKNGEIINVFLSSTPIDQSDLSKGVTFSAMDVTDWKVYEEALAESRSMLDHVINIVPQNIFWKGKDGKYLGCNKNFAIEVGLKKTEDVIGKTDYDMPWNQKDREKYIADDNYVIQSKTRKMHIIEQLQSNDGSRKWIDTSKVPMIDYDGNCIGVLGVYEDITEQKKFEIQVLESREFLSSILQTLPIPFFFKNNEGQYKQFNKAFVDFFGKTENEILNKTVKDLNPKEYSDEFHKKDLELLESKKVQIYEAPVKTAKGIRDVVFHKASITDANDNIIGIIGVMVDVTDQKIFDSVKEARLKLLKYSENHTLSELLTATLDEVELITKSKVGFYHFVESDQNTLSLQAWSTNTTNHMCKATGAGMHYPIDQAGVWVECVVEGKPVIHNDYMSMPNRKGLPEGHAKVFRELVVPIFRGDKIVSILGVGNKESDYNETDVIIARDIADLAWEMTERKRSEQIIRQKEEAIIKQNEIFETLLENIKVGIFMVEAPTGKPIIANKAALNILGRGVMPDANKENLAEVYKVKRLNTDSPYPVDEMPIVLGMIGESAHIEDMVVEKPDGTEILLEVFGTPIKDKENNIWASLVSFYDITERKRIEVEIQMKNVELEELNASKDKFFSIISHDLRSPFNGFLNLTKIMAENQFNLTLKEMQDLSESMRQAAENIYNLLENLLQWSKVQRGNILFEPNELNLKQLANNAAGIAQVIFDQKSINLRINVPDDFVVNADVLMIETVLRNLINNAVKFSNSGGNIEIGLIENSPKNHYCTVYVKDSGVGMIEEVIDGIFRIDRSTSSDGTAGEKGSGLGLILCKEFISMHGGEIWAESRIGEGSTFYFSIPCKSVCY
ncbi:MAG: PAS domain S-box protein [Candidatus Kapabacteria bacterium]|nr:PAS domain S-box protein [Ignavibacteriota bacterium]MCW5885771.1 PAS domain S-box protein [Candidatus Kapabacteria bacterium]